MEFTKKVNVRNSSAVIKEVNQLLEAGFPKKETYVVVGKKYNLSYETVQTIMNGQTLEASNKTLEASNKTLEASNQTLEASNKTLEASNKTLEASPVTSADIVDAIMNKFGKKGDDYITAFDRAPKDVDGAIVMKNGSKVYF